jgi:hypothetical protein
MNGKILQINPKKMRCVQRVAFEGGVAAAQ